MESWFSFDDKLRSGSTFRATRSSRLSSVTASSLSTNSVSMSHLSFLEESRRLDLQAAALRESGRLAGTRRDLEFTSRKLELAAKFKTLMRNTSEHDFDDNLNSSDTNKFPHGEFDELKKNFRAVQEENFKLQAVITDVTEVNKRWQKYNNDRQMYVQRLLSTIQDQQEQMNKIAEDRIFHTKELCNASSADKPTVEALTFENVRLQEEVMLLRKRLESLDKEHKEHVEVLEFQLKAHRDDWEAERSEKQQALQDKEATEKKLRELQKDLRNLKHKYQEEKLQNSSHCRCCASHGGQCNIFLPGKEVHVGQHLRLKTYRTSVHLPCTSGDLLPRGTTIFFGDDLTVDGDGTDEAKITEVPGNTAEVKAIEGKMSARSSADNEHSFQSKRNISITEPHSADKFDGNNNTESCVSERQALDRLDSSESFEIINSMSSENSDLRERKLSGSGIKVGLENCSPSSSSSHVSCSVVHITPSGSGSNIVEAESHMKELGANGDGMAASGVSIGFDHSGLASVMAFSHTPVVKSSSLPTPEASRKKISIGNGKMNPLVSRWSFDSHFSDLSIANPPSVSQNFTASVDSVVRGVKSKDSSFGGACSLSNGAVGLATSAPVQRKPPSWKTSYYEEGAPTQTEDDVICPGCGQIFPPKMHIKFLDHFEKCQSNERDHKRTRSRN